jgi:probable aminopeptidase NPEPL1
MTDSVKSSVKGKGPVRIMVMVEDEYPLGPIAGAISKAFPVFNRKTTSKKTEGDADEDNGDDGTEEEDRLIHVTFLDSKGKIVKNIIEINAAREAAEGVRLACRLVDTHPEELTTTAFAQECHDLFDDDETVTIEEIVGEELKEKGYGGIYNVGKGATHPPRLVILTYEPPKNVLTEESEEQSAITLVGKGIVYDTGGLAIKSRTGMCGMKHDMGGAAGVLGGFTAAVRLRTPRKIRLMLCLAENAIGPNSVRNDDIITQYSGKTVEINNSDAEVSSCIGLFVFVDRNVSLSDYN